MVVFARTVIGASHRQNGKPGQDWSLGVTGRDFAFIAVADGHGGEQYFRSDRGSRLAVTAARECMTVRAVTGMLKKALPPKERSCVIRQLEKSIIGRWNRLVTEDIAANPLTAGELSRLPEKYAGEYQSGNRMESAYGSTLIAVLWTKYFLLVLQIGDGNCVIMDREELFIHPVPADERCFLNTTTSLCDQDAIDEFRDYFCEKLPVAVLIGSDGIDDCFAETSKRDDFYQVIVSSFTATDAETATAELTDYLPRMSEEGSGDDLSVAMIADLG